MSEWRRGNDRLRYLAEVAHLYYIESWNQEKIARKLGVTRSMISHLLADAKQAGLISIFINYPVEHNVALAQDLQNKFGLQEAIVINTHNSSNTEPALMRAAAEKLISLLEPGMILGCSWGSALTATIDAIQPQPPMPKLTIVQLLGAMSGLVPGMDAAQSLQKLQRVLQCTAIHLNAPFVVGSKRMADALKENAGVREALEYGAKAHLALLGIGSTDLLDSPYYLNGYFDRADMEAIVNAGTVGDVCGHFFNLQGQPSAMDYQAKLIGISREDLLGIPQRLGISAGPTKVRPILGALRGSYVNILVTDSATVEKVLAAA